MDQCGPVRQNTGLYHYELTNPLFAQKSNKDQWNPKEIHVNIIYKLKYTKIKKNKRRKKRKTHQIWPRRNTITKANTPHSLVKPDIDETDTRSEYIKYNLLRISLNK